MIAERQIEHRRNPMLEEFLQKMNDLLAPSEAQALARFTVPKYPVILVVGCARSGSTLLMQWLASLGIFAYPTNVLSRFYQAPYIGALIQQVLTNPDLDFRDELHDLHQSSDSFASVLGKTKGALAPHEFWYFWRRFFQFGEIQYLDEDNLAHVDSRTLLAELAAMESVFDKPLAMKGMIINWNIGFINRILPKVVFLHVCRTPLLNAQSLLESRVKFFGNVEEWYSFKPPEHSRLRSLDPYAQVAGQVYFTNKAISDQLGGIDPVRHIAVDYADFCSAPGSLYYRLLEKMEMQSWQPKIHAYTGPTAFETSSELRLTVEESKRIATAYDAFCAGDRQSPGTSGEGVSQAQEKP